MQGICGYNPKHHECHNVRVSPGYRLILDALDDIDHHSNAGKVKALRILWQLWEKLKAINNCCY
jgi:soluble cytochrome b562